MKAIHIARIYMAGVVQSIGKNDFDEFGKATDTLRKARENDNNVWIVGNGGSASNASHLANDLTKMAGIKAFSVPDMTSTTLAYGNDNGWKYMFVDTISKLYRKGDVLFAISCSGNSPNVVACTDFIQHPLIVLTGNNRECKLAKKNPDAIMFTESDDITIQESLHSMLGHALAVVLRNAM